MKQKFRRIILYARQHRANKEIVKTLQRLLVYLEHHAIETYIDQETSDYFEQQRLLIDFPALELPVLSYADMGKEHDLIVVIGGDGSLLSAARIAIQIDVPVIGINRGRLGFLTDILPIDIENKLQDVIDGEYIEENRFLLHMSLQDNNAVIFQDNSLNDVVLHRGNETHLIEFEMYINEQYVCHYRADGLVIATPTGSTAYALSAGGPIMHPRLDAIVIVPMFPHSLSSRPLVVDGQVIIDLFITQQNEHDLRLSCDGHASRMVQVGQQVHIQKNIKQLRLLHPKDYHYYETLQSKLGWEAKITNVIPQSI